MQITLSSSLIETNQSNIEQLDSFNGLFNQTKRHLYKDIIKLYKQNYKNNKNNKLSKQQINCLKSSYQKLFNINSRHYNSIYSDLIGNINSVLQLNKDYINDTQQNIKTLQKSLKIKQANLDSLIKNNSIKANHENHNKSKGYSKNYAFSNLEQIIYDKLFGKIYYLKKRLHKANHKLNKLLEIEKTGNPHLCFGSKKLFNQQFLIKTNNNLTQFKSHHAWKKAWFESRNKTFVLIGSSDESAGNSNCQIKHIEKDIYQLTVNVDKNATKHKDKFISFNIKVHNDKNNYLFNAVNNNLGKDKTKRQALTYRFYKNYKTNTYQIFISLDKSNQQPKITTYKQLGSIGIDINADHLSVCEINHHGNLKKAWDLGLNLKGKSSDQSLDNIACAVKTITDYAVKVNKPIVIEKLDFTQKKQDLRSGFNKKYNEMLSSFAYRKIIELVKSRSFDKGIDIIEINPAYTSKIGKFKYQNQYKLTTHQAASFMIASRGLLSYSKWTNKVTEIKDKDKKVIDSKVERKRITIVYKEKTISIRRIKHYPFDLPVRNSQEQESVYWKELEQNYVKAKKQRSILKNKKKQILCADSSQSAHREITLVGDNSEVNRDLTTNLLFQPF